MFAQVLNKLDYVDRLSKNIVKFWGLNNICSYHHPLISEEYLKMHHGGSRSAFPLERRCVFLMTQLSITQA